MTNATALPGPGQRLVRGILPENPVLRQLLGMCPTLAVTNTLAGAVTMAAATTFVLIMSNLVVSLLRKLLQPHLRILIYTLTIATFVTIADRILKAFLPEMSDKLGPYVPLIIVNCIIISRAEICASKQSVGTAFADAVGVGLGFLLALSAMACVRELLGFGSLFGVQILPESASLADLLAWIGSLFGAETSASRIPWADFLLWQKWSIMVMPAGAFLTLGVIIGVVNWLGMRKEKAGN